MLRMQCSHHMRTEQIAGSFAGNNPKLRGVSASHRGNTLSIRWQRSSNNAALGVRQKTQQLAYLGMFRRVGLQFLLRFSERVAVAI